MHGSGKMCAKPATTKLARSIGKSVTLVGIARDAKGGTVLVTPSGEPVYIESLDYWSPEFSGKEISAMGVLREKKHIPDKTHISSPHSLEVGSNCQAIGI
jgi:hypothetical protein